MGDIEGNIITINASNGALMMKMDTHCNKKKKGCPISKLIYKKVGIKSKLLSAA